MNKYEILSTTVLASYFLILLASYFEVKKSGNKSIDSDFYKLGNTFYNDEESIHGLMFFWISSTSTITFFATFLFFFGKSELKFIHSLTFMKKFIFNYMEVFYLPFRRILTLPLEELLTFFPIEILIYVCLLFFIALVIAYIFAISFIRLIISLLKKKKSGLMFVFIIIWPIIFLVVTLAMASFFN